MTKLSTSSVEDVRENDGSATDEGKTADGHVDIVAGGADAFAVEGVCLVANAHRGVLKEDRPPTIVFMKSAGTHLCA